MGYEIRIPCVIGTKNRRMAGCLGSVSSTWGLSYNLFFEVLSCYNTEQPG
jgi:hypothetical protein